jgi:hypothetical protein
MFAVPYVLTITPFPLPSSSFCPSIHSFAYNAWLSHTCVQFPGDGALTALLSEPEIIMAVEKCSLANGAVPPLSKGEKSVFKMLYPWKIN